MKLLLDTHVLLWAAGGPGGGVAKRMSPRLRVLLTDPENELFFSATSIWEVAIKLGRGRDDFDVDPSWLRANLLNSGYAETPVTGEHAIAVARLPLLHKDPFDRILLAQAMVEGCTLVTVDRLLGQYDGPILHV